MHAETNAIAAAQQVTTTTAPTREQLRDQIREQVRGAVQEAGQGIRAGVADGRATRASLQRGDAVPAPPAPPSPPQIPGEGGRIVIDGRTIELPRNMENGLPRVNVDGDGRMTVVGADGRTTIREPDGSVTTIDAQGRVSQGTATPFEAFGDSVQLDDEILVPAMFFLTVIVSLIGFPIARAIARRMDRKTATIVPQAAAALPAEAMARLERIEQSVDAVAIEVERISEGQRFTTRLMSEMRGGGAPQSAQPQAQQPQLPPASLNETSFGQRAMARPDPLGADGGGRS